MTLQLAMLDAIKYVRRELPLGARNMDAAHPRAENALEYSRVKMLAIDDGTVKTRIDVARRYGAGNCQEMSYMTYDFLRMTRPNDNICLVTVEYHMTVAALLVGEVVDVRFNLANVADTVMFCDPWMGDWAKRRIADEDDDFVAGDASGVYTHARFCELVVLEGESLTEARVVKTTRV